MGLNVTSPISRNRVRIHYQFSGKRPQLVGLRYLDFNICVSYSLITCVLFQHASFLFINNFHHSLFFFSINNSRIHGLLYIIIKFDFTLI